MPRDRRDRLGIAIGGSFPVLYSILGDVFHRKYYTVYDFTDQASNNATVSCVGLSTVLDLASNVHVAHQQGLRIHMNIS